MAHGAGLDNGVFVTLTEFIPPKGTDAAAMVENADQVRGSVDAHNDLIDIPPLITERIEDAEDIPRELMRISNETIAALKEEDFSGTLLATAGWKRRLPEIPGLQLKDAFYSATKEV